MAVVAVLGRTRGLRRELLVTRTGTRGHVRELSGLKARTRGNSRDIRLAPTDSRGILLKLHDAGSLLKPL